MPTLMDTLHATVISALDLTAITANFVLVHAIATRYDTVWADEKRNVFSFPATLATETFQNAHSSSGQSHFCLTMAKILFSCPNP